MTKMTKDDDPEAFINSFERMAITAIWPRSQWAAILTPYLSGTAQTVVDILPVMEAKDYEIVRKTILSTLNIIKETYRMRTREAVFSPKQGPRWLANVIRANGMRWLKPTEGPMEEVVELVWMEQFMAAIPKNARNWVMCNDPRTLEETVKLMESFDTEGESHISRIT